MRKTFIFRVYSPQEIVAVPVEYDPLLLPSVVEKNARTFASNNYIAKHKTPTVELVKIVEESPIKSPSGRLK